MNQEKVETTVLIPMKEDRNVGNSDFHPHTRWTKLDEDLYDKFKGWTVSPGLYEGNYPDPDTGEKVTDSSRVYIIDIDKGSIDVLRTYLGEVVGPMFRQKCIRLTIKGEVEYVVSNLDNVDMFP